MTPLHLTYQRVPVLSSNYPLLGIVPTADRVLNRPLARTGDPPIRDQSPSEIVPQAHIGRSFYVCLYLAILHGFVTGYQP